ncbi:hypothetical protein FRC08_013529 [Ceratobasidium sp. 394]|nr:hypothetical protein FRC08_013529 [Ceratobasidium sp. 394]
MNAIRPTPLPPLADLAAFQGDVPVETAYQRLLPLESSLEGQDRIRIRILGWMMIHAPVPGGRSHVASTINSSHTDRDILDVADFNLKFFVNCFITTSTKPSRTPSNHPSRGSVDTRRHEIMAGLVAAPKNQTQAKEQALVRDDCRCVVTGAVDEDVYEQSRELQETITTAYEPGLKSTQCCHIIPSHIMKGIGDQRKLANSSSVLALLEYFGGINSAELNGVDIHRLENILTLEVGLHYAFDHLRVWFEPVPGQDNTYTVQKRNSITWRDLPTQFTLGTTSEHLALPSRRYLSLRAACAKVLYMSGAAEVIDRVLRDRERVQVLANDGSSAELLDYLLFGAEIMAH